MRQITYYAVTENTDKTEGRGRNVDTGIGFMEEADAVAFVSSSAYRKYAVSGFVPRNTPRAYVGKRHLRIYNSIEEANLHEPGIQELAEAKALLSRLTPEQIKLVKKHG
jgi:hypothetical protein